MTNLEIANDLQTLQMYIRKETFNTMLYGKREFIDNTLTKIIEDIVKLPMQNLEVFNSINYENK
ncbi:hypothetical protein UFOVP1475_4 [uncultured Caudovirales phage]|uniref:Uncharacterized protein n=1 Tax=uncultured Caudovirales phage TaxID=2100421 RepID=A0A6J5SK74_9CAUD|nr:hypothetical protein UFOVP1475_4 [uncultured Caudovirales phage]